MKKFSLMTFLLLGWWSVNLHALEANALPSQESLNAQLAEAEKLSDEKAKASQVEVLTASLDWLKQIEAQEKANQALQEKLAGADSEIQQNSAEIEALKAQLDKQEASAYQHLSLAQAQAELASLQTQQQDMQEKVTQANSQLASQETLSERSQAAQAQGALRTQELNRLLADSSLSSQTQQQYQLEQAFLSLKAVYNQELLKNNDQLIMLYQSRYNLLNLQSQLLQNQILALQEVINQKNLAESQEQLAQSQQQQQAAGQSSFIQRQLDRNTQLSQFLLEQTELSNKLTQDDLRMRNVLENLKQTQSTIDEQISALQGTLVLSRIIQQQRQRLPENLDIKGLSKQIADLRVQIFDYTQRRNELYDLNSVIARLQADQNQAFSANEKAQLENLLTDRRRIQSDIIKSLNNQLNLAINLELTQQQISQISDQLQAKLDQQSFWVKSNNPIYLDWFKALPAALLSQIEGISNKISLQTDLTDLPYLLAFAAILALIGGVIYKFRPRIRQRLALINGQLNTLSADSQWHTPFALAFTAILALPSVLWFLAVSLLVGFFVMRNPAEMWQWALEMAGYWWFFAFLVALLRPNGIAKNHFGFSDENVEKSRNVAYRMWIAVTLLLNTSVFSSVADSGIANDVLGEINTIAALIFTLFIIAPRLRRAVNSFTGEKEGGQISSLILRTIVIVAPMVLIGLIVLGYYYTALNLIDHLILTYMAWCVWMWIRQTIYRGITVSSRRLAHQRLVEKRAEQALATKDDGVDDIVKITPQDEGLELNKVRSQVIRVADMLLWTALFVIMYYIWADLITVVSYLRGVELWTQITTTEAGTVTESITLFNGLMALLIIGVSYALIKNLSGILEVSLFSRFKFSQGTPYTITTLLTYGLIALGGAWAFSTLGMSWSKLQWLFAALSVGLGFGLQEIFANFVSGIILLFERPIRVGDTVTINGVTGTVARIRIRAITMIDPDRKEVIMPNKSFVTGQVTNWALSNTVTRLVVSVGVAYGSDLELVKRLLLQAAHEHELVLKDPAPSALFLGFGASTLDHELRVYVQSLSDRMVTTDSLNRRINQLFAENDIEIAFNQLDVFIKNQDTGAEMPVVEVKKN
ncbi:hypothetical protein A4G20_05400 [Pasteurellaceae bacterium RH1A]|nr:hypothetical protein A4G20_05400 [Pasteurellaceae bacterium RH1A]